MTTESTDFAPTLPRSSEPALAPRSATAALPGELLAATPEAAQVEPAPPAAEPEPTGQALSPPAPARPGARRSGLHRVGGWFARAVIAVMVLAAGVVPVLVARAVIGTATLTANGENDDLPRYDVAPPAYGTAQLVFDQTAGNEREEHQLVVNGDASTIYFTSLDSTGSLAGALLLSTPTAEYSLYAGQSVWTLESRDGSAEWDLERTFGRVFTFSDYLPDEMRRFASVAASRQEVLAGRELQYIELLIDTGRAAREEPTAYGDFAFDDGTEPLAEAAIRVVLYVDAAGVVWQMETWGDDTPDDKLIVTLQSFALEPFTPQEPLQYYDATNGGVLVGG